MLRNQWHTGMQECHLLFKGLYAIELQYISFHTSLCQWSYFSLYNDSNLFPYLVINPAETSKNSENCDFSKVSDIENALQSMPTSYFKWYHLSSVRVWGKWGYIEKSANIGTSELRGEVSRFFNDATGVNGCLPINAQGVSTWLCTFYNGVSMPQEVSIPGGVPSLKNPEMSQRSSDVPMLVNFSTYISLMSSIVLGGIIYLPPSGKTLTFHRFLLKSETVKKSQLSEPIDPTLQGGWMLAQ